MAEKHPAAPFPIPEIYFTKYLDFQTESPRPGRTVVALELQPHHRNITGAVHGGFLMTVLDTLMGHAVFTYLGDPQARFGTSQMTTHFLRVVSRGRLTGEARVVSGGNPQAGGLSAEASLRDDTGQLVVTAEAQFTLIRPAGARE